MTQYIKFMSTFFKNKLGNNNIFENNKINIIKNKYFYLK